MDWYIIIALMISISVIFFPAAYIWYIAGGGILKAVRESRLEVLEGLGRTLRMAMLVTVPLAIYVSAIWLTLGNFGWHVALATGLVLPIVLIAPLLVWVAMASGIYIVLTDKMRRRSAAARRVPVAVVDER